MKLPLNKRIEQARPPETMTLSSETVGSVLLGASLLSGVEYLSWETKRLFEGYAAKNMKPMQFRYGLMIHHAAEKMPQISDEFREEGNQLLYELAIEPFYLISREQQKQNGE